MKRLALVCLWLVACLLLHSTTIFAWQETPPGSGNWVSQPSPPGNLDRVASGGSTVDVLSGHSVNGVAVGIGLMTAGYTVTNYGSVFGGSFGVWFFPFANGSLRNYGTIAGGVAGVFCVLADCVIDNHGDIIGGSDGLDSIGFGDVSVSNTGRIAGTGLYGVNLTSISGNAVLNNQGEIGGGQYGAELDASGNISIVNTG